MRKTFTPEQKGKIVLEAIKEVKSLNQIASEYDVHPNVIGQWKKTARENVHTLFGSGKKKEGDPKKREKEIDELHRIIGKRDTEIEWLKKTLNLDP